MKLSARASIVTLILISLCAGCSHLKMGLFMFHENLGENDPASIVRGKEAFVANCVACHGSNADGRGPDVESLRTVPTNFLNPEYTKSPARIAAHIAYGKGADMPPFSEKLSEATIWDIANYLHSLQKVPG